MLLIGLFLALLVGISLGLVGSGGSILTVPILVYILNVDPVLATGYSLFIVGISALFGGTKNLIKNKLDLKPIVLFAIPSVVSVFLTRAFLVPIIPDVVMTINHFQITKPIFMMLIFAIVMLGASVSMISRCEDCDDEVSTDLQRFNYPMIALMGLLVGFITGLVGAGGGFLIIPALVFFAKIPMKNAVSTSLIIIAINSAIGFLGFLKNDHATIDWLLLIKFSSISIIGIFVGTFLSTKIPSKQLKSGFGWFVLTMGVYILVKELWM